MPLFYHIERLQPPHKVVHEPYSSENLSGRQSFRREKRPQESSGVLISPGSSSPSEAPLPGSTRD